MEDPESVVQTVEIIKRPGQSLGFYIREGNGRERWDGVFISRLAAGSVAEQNGLLKIGDEILTVNGAPVSRKRLEDVVISMSIPKRLVLAVRRNPNAVNMSGDAASLGSSLSGGVPGGEEEQLPPVVVVKCPRPSQQYGTGSLGSSIMIPCHSSKSPGSDHYQQGDFYIGDQQQQQRYAYSSSPAAGVQRRGDDYWGSLGKMGTSGALMIQTQQQGFFGGDDSGDSGLSSDNSGFFRQVESSGPSASTSLSKGGSSQGKDESGSQSGSGNQVVTFRHDEDFGDDISSAVSPNQLLQAQSFQQMQQQQSASGRPTSFNNTLGTCRAPSIERCTTGYPRTATLSTGYQRRSCSARPDYSSDSDTYTFDHSVRHKLGALRSHPNAAATEFYPEQTLSGGSLDWPSHYNPRWHFSPGEYATLDRRFSYSTAAEHHLAQQQRWDALDSAALAWTQRARERQTAGRDHRYMMQMGIPAPGEKLMPACYGQEIQPGGASSSLNSLLRQFDTFSLDQARSPYLSDDLTSLYSAGGGVSSDKETYTLGRQMSLNFPYGVVGGSGSATGKSPPTSQMDVTRMMAAAAVTNPRRRMARKLGSTGDCGPADYAEVIEDETSATLRSLQMNMGPRAASATSQQQLGTVSGSSSSSSTSSHQSRTLTRNPTMPSVPSTTASNSGAPNTSANTSMEAPPKSLIKAPLHIRKEAFKPYQSILPHQSSKTESSDERGQTPPPPLDGCLVCHVFCGHGLVSNRAVLQDLYCVVELDSLGCARTTVHTGAMNFDWDDRFEMDLHTARFLSFSVYSYDPGQGARHRLVYGGSVYLANLLQKPSEQYLQQQQQQHHRLALQLQPRGTLYIELFYQTVDLLYRRTPSLHLSSLFGTELATVVEREKSGRNVPMLLIRCIEEVERRGLDQVGVYRLCGSARRKQQLREELEKNPFHIDLSPSVVGDINVVTVILKDFLRELPEPVCTDSMYHLLLDALSVHITEGKVSGQVMMGFVDCCPKTNQDTLFCILDHLKKVSQRCGVNKMSPINVSIIFGPLLFHPSTTSSASSDFAEKHQLTRHAELLRFLLEVYALE